MIQQNKILSREEFILKMNELLDQRVLETGKSKLEILREMEYFLSQKDEASLTPLEKGILTSLRKADKKHFGT